MSTATSTPTPTSSIHSRALLVWLTIRTWSARKYDRKISDKVNAEYAASSDAGRYNKFLLPGDCKAYKQLITIASSIRLAHYAHTLAWSDEGWRLLPTANFMDYAAWFRKQQSEFRDAFRSFIDDYPNMRSAARALLNGMYRDEDYPSVQDMQQRFSLDVSYSPLPNFGDVRVDLASDQIKTIEQQINNRIGKATEIAMQDCWSRLFDVVSKMHERLAEPDAVFRDTLIGNAREICGVLQKLNVTNDSNLEAMRRKVLDQLTTYDPDVLRDNSRVRSAVADRAAEIMRQMAPFYQPAK